MVRLKLAEETQKRRQEIEFQFQYGTIKARVHPTRPRPREIFQFQYGTIKALHHQTQAEAQLYFNSSMVRLKPMTYWHL